MNGKIRTAIVTLVTAFTVAAAMGVSPSLAQAESNIAKTKHETVKNTLSNVR